MRKQFIRCKNLYVAKNLRHLRTVHKLAQSRISDQLTIERSTYTYYELGKTEPSVSSITKIIEFYNNELGLTLTFDDMLGKSLVDEGIPMRFADDDAVFQFLSKKNEEFEDSMEFYEWLKDWATKFVICVGKDVEIKSYEEFIEFE